MKRILHIVGCIALVVAGMAIAMTTDIWPLVWVGGFPLTYAGALGLYETWTVVKPSKTAGRRPLAAEKFGRI